MGLLTWGLNLEPGCAIFLRIRDQEVEESLRASFDVTFKWTFLNSDEAEQYFKLFYVHVETTPMVMDAQAIEFGERVAGAQMTQRQVERHLLQWSGEPEEAVVALDVSF